MATIIEERNPEAMAIALTVLDEMIGILLELACSLAADSIYKYIEPSDA